MEFGPYSVFSVLMTSISSLRMSHFPLDYSESYSIIILLIFSPVVLYCIRAAIVATCADRFLRCC